MSESATTNPGIPVSLDYRFVSNTAVDCAMSFLRNPTLMYVFPSISFEINHESVTVVLSARSRMRMQADTVTHARARTHTHTDTH